MITVSITFLGIFQIQYQVTSTVVSTVFVTETVKEATIKECNKKI